MQPTFQPPKTHKEFKERAERMTMEAAKAMLSTLKNQRAKMVQAIDQEIKFYEKAIVYKQSISEDQDVLFEDL